MTDRAVLLSIKPKYCELIANSRKTIEVRKTRPKIETPFKCYIYCTQAELLTKSHLTGKIYVASNKKYKKLLERRGNLTLSGKVIGEFVCDKIITIDCDSVAPFDYETKEYVNKESCLSRDDFAKYTDFKMAYGWHISDFKIYDKPKTLDDFRKPCISPEMPYCPLCKVGCEYIGETEAEFYRVDGECNTEWCCLNWIKKAPQSWCYVQEVE